MDLLENSNVPKRLHYLKCSQCRKDKKKCLPVDRSWPQQKCNRCAIYHYACSASMTASQDKQLQQRQDAAPSMPPPPRPGPSSGESVMPGSGQFNYGQLGQQAGSEQSWPKCAPCFSTLIQASWGFFGLPEPAIPPNLLARLMMQKPNYYSVDLALGLSGRVYMVTTIYQFYARTLQEGISNGMSREEFIASLAQRMTDEATAGISKRAGDLQTDDHRLILPLHDFEPVINATLRWKALFDAVGVHEVFLIDHKEWMGFDSGDGIPVPSIAYASDEEWPHFLSKLLSPEFGLKETCLRLSGIADMIERLIGLEQSDLRSYLVSSIEKRVKSVLGTKENLPGYVPLSSDDDSMADAE